eukprot:3406237-Rhodomonas_salina.1
MHRSAIDSFDLPGVASLGFGLGKEDEKEDAERPIASTAVRPPGPTHRFLSTHSVPDMAYAPTSVSTGRCLGRYGSTGHRVGRHARPGQAKEKETDGVDQRIGGVD